MKTYLVGGYVRDQLLHRPAHERDWVVVGADPKDLLDQGYTPVGKSFPVFLHPQTHEEYALARIERKVATGHTGFTCDSNKTVTLEQDLQRRDLTINAIAMDETGTLIDPCDGQRDLQQRILRHVAPAFMEDPLRILRVARLRAQLAAYDFTVAPETTALMQSMVTAGELQTLSAERVWGELHKALASPNPVLFFETLASCGADRILFPKLHNGVIALQAATVLTTDTEIRFAAAMYEDPECLKVPNNYKALAQLTHRFHDQINQALSLDATALLSLIMNTDGLRRPQRFEQLLLTCQAMQQSNSYPVIAFLQKLQQQLLQLDLSEIMQHSLSDREKAEKIREKRIALIGGLRPLG